MKAWQKVAIAAVIVLGVAKVTGALPGVHSDTGEHGGVERGVTAYGNPGTLGSSGVSGSGVMVPGSNVIVPGMNSGYSCDLGELGKPIATKNKKEFWGDDDVSQSFKRTSDLIQNSVQRSLRESGVSL
ncbi:MAG: hypothetical protein EKK48_10565 [Candidatus Melainabacteria bacterium]|nr:MAG: hypothetical protein EKK48_10565 [Candidatus Melainabacteria bacterium]